MLVYEEQNGCKEYLERYSLFVFLLVILEELFGSIFDSLLVALNEALDWIQIDFVLWLQAGQTLRLKLGNANGIVLVKIEPIFFQMLKTGQLILCYQRSSYRGSFLV